MFKKSAEDKFTQNLIFGLAMIHICAKLARIGVVVGLNVLKQNFAYLSI